MILISRLCSRTTVVVAIVNAEYGMHKMHQRCESGDIHQSEEPEEFPSLETPYAVPRAVSLLVRMTLASGYASTSSLPKTQTGRFMTTS